MKVAGLFSGIGGLELPFHEAGSETALLCDVWDSSRRVLGEHFPGVPLFGDIRDLEKLPSDLNVLTAGFPCTDLSQAGRTAGISGKESGLVSYVFSLLHLAQKKRRKQVDWIVLENVRNMLVLDKGRAMHFLTSQLEELGFRWAYRLIDSRFSGVPQRRHRVILVASKRHDPREVLFSTDAGEPSSDYFRDDAFGFYWTEGLRGLGWAPDAVPPLKGGSSIGIPSPPAVWLPFESPERQFVTPSIEDAEALQGFPRGWTSISTSDQRAGVRWKLVGNAVTVGVSRWLVTQMLSPSAWKVPCTESSSFNRWPDAAYGARGKIWNMHASTWPERQPYQHLTDLLEPSTLAPLSPRAVAGFLERADRAKLNFNKDFLAALRNYQTLLGGRRITSKSFVKSLAPA